MTRVEAYVELLELPDPSDLAPRCTVQTFARHPPGSCGPDCMRTASSDPWQIKKELGIAYVERIRNEWTDGDISRVVSVRRLKVVRRA